MTSDPRMAQFGTSTGGSADRARYHLAMFDEADAAAGVVRVDTRDPATARRLHFAVTAYMYSSTATSDCVRAVLAALTEATP